jgi:hypothetical protein
MAVAPDRSQSKDAKFALALQRSWLMGDCYVKASCVGQRTVSQFGARYSVLHL